MTGYDAWKTAVPVDDTEPEAPEYCLDCEEHPAQCICETCHECGKHTPHHTTVAEDGAPDSASVHICAECCLSRMLSATTSYEHDYWSARAQEAGEFIQ